MYNPSPTTTSSGHTSRAKDPAIVQEAQKPLEFISVIFAKIATFLVVGLVIFFVVWFLNRPARQETSTQNQSTTSVPKTEIQTQQPWTFRTLNVPPEGVTVYLYQGWKDFPIGGAITITNNQTGELLNDEPGVTHHFGFQQDGLYTIRPNPAGSKRQVQIYNRW